jgi:hypothetical protein
MEQCRAHQHDPERLHVKHHRRHRNAGAMNRVEETDPLRDHQDAGDQCERDGAPGEMRTREEAFPRAIRGEREEAEQAAKEHQRQRAEPRFLDENAERAHQKAAAGQRNGALLTLGEGHAKPLLKVGSRIARLASHRQTN